MCRSFLISTLIVLSTFISACNTSGDADTVLYNGKIITVDSNFSIARAIAIKDGKILSVGSDEEIRKLAGKNTKIFDLEGRAVVPGLIDAHAHPDDASISELDGAIPDVHSMNELLEWISSETKRKKQGEWIIHPKLFFTRLKELRPPTLAELDSVAPNNPVFLDGSYGGFVNTAALKTSGITEENTDPGIIRDKKNHRITGFIRSRAYKFLKTPQAKQPTDAERESALLALLAKYNQLGFTSFCSGAGDYTLYEYYRKLNNEHKLNLRVFQNIYLLKYPGETADMQVDTIKSYRYKTNEGDDMVKIGALKIILDGGILTGTAFMREPWGNTAMGVYGITDTAYRGIVNYSREDLLKIVKAAYDNNWKFTAHCTGGGGVDLLLDVFEEVNRTSSIKDKRFSIIHGNFYTKEAIKRMKEFGIFADMQPDWFYKDADAMKYILSDKRIETFHPYKSLIDEGVKVNGGSDHMIKTDPNESINPYNPFISIWAIVTRTTERGNTIVSNEAISREEALKMYTINNATASFDENIKGSIEAGKLADLAVLSDDILTCPVENIKHIQSELTLLGGRTVYSSGKLMAAK